MNDSLNPAKNLASSWLDEFSQYPVRLLANTLGNRPSTYGNDTHIGKGVTRVLNSGTGDDLIYGGAQADTIFAGVGNDTIAAGGGNDTIYGGTGNDVLTGGSGRDVFELERGSVGRSSKIFSFNKTALVSQI